jgi:hypothetical protein
MYIFIKDLTHNEHSNSYQLLILLHICSYKICFHHPYSEPEIRLIYLEAPYSFVFYGEYMVLLHFIFSVLLLYCWVTSHLKPSNVNYTYLIMFKNSVRRELGKGTERIVSFCLQHSAAIGKTQRLGVNLQLGTKIIWRLVHVHVQHLCGGPWRLGLPVWAHTFCHFCVHWCPCPYSIEDSV